MELLVVLSLLSFGVAIALPKLQQSATVKHEANVRSIAIAFREAQRDAITQGAPRAVDVDVHQRTVRYQRTLVRLDQTVALLAEVAARDAVDDSVVRFVFFPDGSARGGFLAVQHASVSQRIEVDWLTGVVTVRRIRS